MKPKLLFFLALVLGGGLVGCSSLPGQAQKPNDPVSSGLTNTFGKFDPSSTPFTLSNTNFDDDISSLYSIEARVTKITKTRFLLQSITVRFIRPLSTAKGIWTPFGVGDTITIYFYEPLAELGNLRLTIGSKVRLNVIEFELTSHTTVPGGDQATSSDGTITDREYVWRSVCSCLTVEKNGAFYDRNGETVKWDVEP